MSLDEIKQKIFDIKNKGLKNVLFNTSAIDENAIKNYNEQIKNLVPAEQALANVSKNTNQATISLIKSANGAAVSTHSLKKAQKEATVASNMQSKAIKALSVGLNTIASILITQAIAGSLNFIITKISEAVNAYEDGIDKVKNLTNEVKSLGAEQSSLNKELKTSQERLNELQTIKIPNLFEEDEIENLKEYNKELETKIRLNNLDLEQKNNKANQEAQNSYSNFMESPVERGLSRNDLLNEAIDTYKRTQEAYEKAVASGDEFAIENNKKALDNLKSHYKDMLLEYSSDLNLIIGGLDPNIEGNDLIIKNINEILERINQVYEINPIPKNFAEVYNDAKFSSVVVELERLAKQGELTEETFNNVEGIDEFKKALFGVGETDIAFVVSSIVDHVSESDSAFDNASGSATNYAEALTKVKEAIDGVLKNSKLFQDAIEKLKGGEDLTYDEVMGLVEIDTSIATNVQKTADGYSIAIQTLIDADNNYRNAQGVGVVQEQINQNTADIAAAEKEIANLNAEKEKLRGSLAGKSGYDAVQIINQMKMIDDEIAVVKGTIDSANESTAALNISLMELSNNTDILPDNSFTGIVSGIEGMTSKLENLAKVYNDVKDGAEFDWSAILNNDDFKKTFADCTETYDTFIETVSNSPTDIEACQSAFNNLVGEYIETSGVLSNLTEETKSAAIAMLEQNGIANATEIVEEKLRQLAIAKENEANMSELLAKKTLEEKDAFLDEIKMSEETAEALFKVLTAKIKINATKIESESDIDALIAIAKQAGATEEAIIQLNRAKSGINAEFDQGLYNRGEYLSKHGGFSVNNADNMKAIQYYQDQLALSQVKAGNIDFENNGLNFKPETPEYKPKESSSGSDSSSSKEDTKKTFDWIERAIERVQKAATKLSNIAKNTFKSLTTRNNALRGQIQSINKEIELQQSAYVAYMQKANSVGLSAELMEKVQNGSIDISEYSSETAEIIDEYKEWYDKAQDCKDAIDELHESLASLYKEKFDNIQTDFENQLGEIEHLANSYNIAIDTAEAKGYIQSTSYYAALEDSQRSSLSTLKQELASLQGAFSEAMSSGEIEAYSDEWYTMREQIHNVNEEIMEGTQKLAEYAKTMREIEWGHFDYLQERISDVTEESNFLIDLMGDVELYDDKGNYTDKGLSVLGLHAQNYNVLMAQADKYAEEMSKIERQMSSDKYNVDLINRKRELIKLQQESISAAEDEKKAMIDLAKTGIEEQINSLKDLIQAYTDALDAAKGLHDYQRKIADQTSEIASLEKQLLAYENDTSEETKATVQKIKSSLKQAKDNLKETEYERYISEQKNLLDSLYAEYEEYMNERMDNIDAEFADLINTVNSNASTIAKTLRETADDVGYTLSDSMQTIWNEAATGIKDVVALYGENFTSKLTTINDALNNIALSVRALITAANANAASSIEDIKNNANIPTTTTSPTTPTKPNNKPNNNQSASTNKSIKVGGKVYAGNASIYDYANAPASAAEKQVFAHDPVYTVLRELGNWILVRWHKANSGYSGWFKKSDVRAYKTGGLVNYTGLAQLDGTPSKPEYVLNAKETQNFFALSNELKKLNSNGALSHFADAYLKSAAPKGTDIQRVDMSNNVDVGGININIDHVQDYDDFVNQLAKDKQFEKYIRAVSVDRAVGKSSLRKNNIKW